MADPGPTILAVGAAGKYAGLVVPELARRGATVRGLIRDEQRRAAALRNGAAEIALGDLRDRASVEVALRGVDAVFYIAPAFIRDEAAIGRAMVAAARQAGVRRFIFSSVIDPTLTVLVNHRDKIPVEEALLESGMEYVFLHPALFFQNLAGAWARVMATGSYAEPWSAESRFSRVDYRDVAEVAAIALMEDRLTYGTYELCAAGDLNRRELAALMGEVLGRAIRPDTVEPPATAGTADDDQQAGLRAMFSWYDAHDLRGNALTLRAILGREPRTLRAYFEELAAVSSTAD